MKVTRKKAALILAEAAAKDMGIMQILRAVTRENGKRYEASEKMATAIAQLIELIDDPRSKALINNWYKQTLISATRALERAKFQPAASAAKKSDQPAASAAKKSDPQPPTQKERDLLAAGDKTAVLRQKARVAHARGDKKGLQAATASLRQLPKIGTGAVKENKETNSMITRERLEEILREEIVAVTEGRDSEDDTGGLYREAAAGKPAKKKGEFGYFDGMVGGTLGTLAAVNVDKIQAFAEKLGNVVDNVTNPEVLNQIMQLLQQASSAVMEGEDAALTELLNLLEGHMGQEAPPVENDQRARELLDGFKNMLKPQERAEPSACATFLRQLADMAEREGGAPDAETMPEPVPNN